MDIVKRFVKWFSVLMLLLGFILLAVLLWLARPLEESKGNVNELGSKYLIAHAGGAIDGHTYTNSKEALINALDNGFRYIELDLYETKDRDVVCLHHLEDYHKMTSTYDNTLDTKTFLTHQLYGKYTPMTLNDVIKIWEEHPFFFVTDKISDPKILNKFFKTNRANVYVETFSVSEYRQLKRDGYVPMLSVGDGIVGLLKYVVTNIYSGGVNRIVTYYQTPEYILRIYKRLGSKIAVYTVNDISYLKTYIGKYVDMVYTDNIIPSND